MSISSHHPKKEPTNDPVAFYKGEVKGSKHGKGGSNIPLKLSGGPTREKLMGHGKKK